MRTAHPELASRETKGINLPEALVAHHVPLESLRVQSEIQIVWSAVTIHIHRPWEVFPVLYVRRMLTARRGSHLFATTVIEQMELVAARFVLQTTRVSTRT